MSTPVPASSRLRFREYTVADEPLLYELFADPAARRFYPELADPATVSRRLAWTLDHYRAAGFGLWALELKRSGAFLGDCGLTWQDVEGRRELEIGYHLLAAHRGHGYATEAARACLDYAWAHTSAALVCSIVRPSNVASRGVAGRVHASVREVIWKGSPALLFYTLRAVG